MLSKNEIAIEIESMGAGAKNQIKHILDALAELAQQEISKGEDFTVPGIAKVRHHYIKPRKKGEKYVGFGGEEVTADKARKAKLSLKANPVGAMKKVAPSLASKGGKAVAARKG